jgi:hypothetical protein
MNQLHPSLKVLTPYVVALFGIEQEGPRRFDVQHAGSGTLIAINGVFGIITAGHVVERLEEFEIWALSSFNSFNGHSRMYHFTKTDKTIRLGDDYRNTDGPDIGFIRLPDDIVSQSQNEMTFYNITSRYKAARSQSGKPNKLNIRAIAGVIGEASSIVEKIDGSTEVETKTLVAPAQVISAAERVDMDYYTVKIGQFEGGEQPSSYGGMSGGPLFATRENATMSERILMGVMYRQSDVDENGDRTISCHGFSSIYDQICPIITLKFAEPSEFMRLNNLNADGSPA